MASQRRSQSADGATCSNPPVLEERPGSPTSDVELSDLRPGSRPSSSSATSNPSGDDDRSQCGASNVSLPTTVQSVGDRMPLTRFWSNHVAMIVQPEASRDHLAIERTFLGYFRTSLAFAIMGTVISQLFLLNQQDEGFGYSEIGRPMSTACLSFSIIIVLLGGCRTWRHQHAVAVGKALVGGFEVAIIAFGTILLGLAFLGLLISVGITKETSSKL